MTFSGTIVLVGPTHPYRGGIAQHTTRLAIELESRGNPVAVESWRAQYPKRLYRGSPRVPEGEVEIGLPQEVRDDLAWYSPISWWRAGWRNRKAATVGLNIPTPFHAIPYVGFLWGLGRSAHTIGIVHNPLPHEATPFDRLLMGYLLKKLDTLIVHDEKAGEIVASLNVDRARIQMHSLPSPWPATSHKPRSATSGPLRALFFGTVRNYKGVDILIDAIAQVSHVQCTIAGEFWDDQADYDAQISRRGLDSRVSIRAGYVPQTEFESLFSDHDLLVLPYRSGTGSIVREVAFRFGLPVIATNVGSIAEGIDDGVNGRVVPAGSVEALAEALQEAASPQVRNQWAHNLGDYANRQETLWREYCEVFTSHDTKNQEAADE